MKTSLKVLAVIVAVETPLPTSCAGMKDDRYNAYYPNACPGLGFGMRSRCIYTGKDIENPEVRPAHCPLVSEKDVGEIINVPVYISTIKNV